MSAQVETSQRIYNARAPKYDESHHPQQAADYVRWADPQPGEYVLDLCCGTGLIGIDAARCVGPSGSVTGVDVAEGMLAEAQRKSDAEGLTNVAWLAHDASRLDELKDQLRPGGYDVIIAVACLALFPDAEAVIKHWANFLKPGGRLVFEMLNERMFIPGLLWEGVASKVGAPMPFYRGWVKGLASVENVAREAGLKVERSFVASGYGLARTYKADQGPELFEEWAGGTCGGLLKPEQHEEAKRLFVEGFQGLADSDGAVKEDEGFYTVIAVKPE